MHAIEADGELVGFVMLALPDCAVIVGLRPREGLACQDAAQGAVDARAYCHLAAVA